MIADLSQQYHRPRWQRRAWEPELRAMLSLVMALILVVILGSLVHASLASPDPKQVTVQPGDTLWSIAASQSGGGDVRSELDAVMEANHLSSAQLTPGQVLLVPQT